MEIRGSRKDESSRCFVLRVTEAELRWGLGGLGAWGGGVFTSVKNIWYTHAIL